MMTVGQSSQANTRFVMLGRFLGWRKTAALVRLARRYVAVGPRVQHSPTPQVGEKLTFAQLLRCWIHPPAWGIIRPGPLRRRPSNE